MRAVSILCESRAESIAEIVVEWQRLTDREPWNALSRNDWVDHLPPLLSALLDAGVCHPGSHEERRRVVEAATKHGEQRRAHDLPIDVLLEEHSALRTAVWHFLSHRLGRLAASGSLGEIIRFDAAATFAAMGSLRGYHRIEIERERDWASEIDQLVAEWEQMSDTLGADAANDVTAKERHPSAQTQG